MIRNWALCRLVIAAFAAASMLGAASARAVEIWDKGNVEIVVSYVGGQLQTGWRVDPTKSYNSTNASVNYAASELQVSVPASSYVTEPFSSNDKFGATQVGLSETSSYWKLEGASGLANQDQAPFLGLSANGGFNPVEWTNVKFTLTSYSGPGEFAMWGPASSNNTYFKTVDGVDPASDVIAFSQTEVGTDIHPHFNWGFSEAGTYNLGITVSGTHVTEGNMSASGVFTFNVQPVPEPSSVALAIAGAGLVGVGFWRRRKASR